MEKRVLVTIPQKYFTSQLWAKWCKVSTAIALRRAQLWKECLQDEEENLLVDNGQHEGIEYQILMFGQHEYVFQSAADLPAPCYEDYGNEGKQAARTNHVKEKTLQTSGTVDKNKACSMGDHWLQEQDGVIIRKHLIPRTNLMCQT